MLRYLTSTICNYFYFNPLLPELFSSSFLGTKRRIGYFRLPTHSRETHEIFFVPSYFRIEILAFRELLCALGSKGLINFETN